MLPFEKELFEADALGLIPEDKEDVEPFLARVEKALSPVQKTRGCVEEMDPAIHWDWVRSHLREVFDIDPIWLSVVYSNQSLAPWQAAATWTSEGKLLRVQLREAFRKGSFLGLYQREDILAHEAVHGARSSLNSTKWEEFFAYMVAETKGRRFLGPLIGRPWEVWPFLGMSALGALLHPLFSSFALGWAALGFFRLGRRRLLLKKAAKEIGRFVSGDKAVRAVLVRLKDEEIDALAKGKKLEELAKDQTSLRWKILRRKRIQV